MPTGAPKTTADKSPSLRTNVAIGAIAALVVCFVALFGTSTGQQWRSELLHDVQGAFSSALPTGTTLASTPLPIVTASTPATALPTAPIYRIGDKVTSGNWSYRITGVASKTALTPQVVAKGVWIIVGIELTNIGAQNFGIGLQDFSLKSADGVTYDPDTSGRVLSLYGNGTSLISSFDNDPPGVPFQTALVFDVNPNGAGWHLYPKQANGLSIDLGPLVHPDPRE